MENKDKISISYDQEMFVTSYALIGAVLGGVDVTDYPDNLLSDFTTKKFKYTPASNKVTEVKDYKPEPLPLPEVSDHEKLQNLVADQGLVLAQQKQTISMQSAMLDSLMEQLALVGMVVTKPKEEK